MNENNPGDVISDLATGLVNQIMLETSQDPAKSLVTPTAQKERLTDQVTQILSAHFARIDNGIAHLLDRLELDPSLDQTLYATIKDKLSVDITENGFSNHELNALYNAAVDIYNHQEYNHAADAFYVLTVFDARSLFWKCLGNAEFLNNQYKAAFDAYAMALKLHEQDPECLIYQSRCLQQENRLAEAIDLLNQASNLINQDPKFNALKETVADLIQSLKNK